MTVDLTKLEQTEAGVKTSGGPVAKDEPVLDDPTDVPPRGSVVVGFDGSPGAIAALEWARRFGRRLGPVVTATSPSRAHPFHRRGSGAGEDLVAWSRDAVLLVVGSRGRGRWSGAFLGSVGAYCAHHSLVPVAIVPPGVDPTASIDRVAVGVDGSENSIAALRWVLRSTPATSIVDLWFTWLTPPLAASLDKAEAERVHDASRSFLDAVVDRVVGEENAWDRTIHRNMGIGDPAEVLHDATTSVIVAGARSETGLLSLLMDSPSDALLGETQAVVVFVPSQTHHQNPDHSRATEPSDEGARHVG